MVRIANDAAASGTANVGSIQVLRGAAALAVVLAHIWPEMAALGQPNAVPNFILGAAGVDLFFVISGFVMVYTSESLFCARGAAARFVYRRLCRIVPLYWLATTVVLVGWLMTPGGLSVHGAQRINVIASYLFFPWPWSSRAGNDPILGAGWTLNYEMLFYAVFAAALFLSRRRAVTAVTAALLAMVAWPALVPYPHRMLANSFLYEFAFGLWIAFLYREGLRLHPVLSGLLVAIGIGLLVITDIDGFATISRTTGWGGGAALVVAGTALADTRPLAAALWRPALLLGDASYALYLVHYFIGRLHWGFLVDPAAHPWLYAAVLVGASIAAAIGIHLLIERPATRALQQIPARWRTRWSWVSPLTGRLRAARRSRAPARGSRARAHRAAH